jgi:hypothetical protein
LALTQCQSLRIADPTPGFTLVEKSEFFFTFSHNIVTVQCFIFSRQCHMYHVSVFGQHIEIFWNGNKSVFYQPFHFLEIDTNPDLPDSDPSK